MERDTDEFRRLTSYLSDQRVEADNRRRPEQAAALFDELKADLELFARRILHTGGSDSLWARTPILQHIDASAFADWLVIQHPANQREILMSLSIRYDHDALNRDLAQERPWLERLRVALTELGAGFSPLSRDRLTKNIEWFVTPKLDGLPDPV